jgi:hypothetical protein
LKLHRTRWQVVGGAAAGGGGDADNVLPLDALVLLDAVEDTVSLAVRELCCRLGIAALTFIQIFGETTCAFAIAMVYRESAARRVGK